MGLDEKPGRQRGLSKGGGPGEEILVGFRDSLLLKQSFICGIIMNTYGLIHSMFRKV